MTVKITKPQINVREELNDLKKPTGIAGEAMLRAETVAEQQALIGVGRKNLIINGANQVNQRGTLTGVNIATNTYGGPDRRSLYVNHPGGSAFTLSQEASGPGEFNHSFLIDCTTAGATLTGGQEIKSEHSIEAYDVAGVGFGTPYAKSLTVSFWVKSNQAADYVLWMYREDGTRHNSKVYTINSANTWEFKTLTFNPDTSNTVAVDNTTGLYVSFILNAGPSYTSGTSPNGNWQNIVSANRYVGLTATIGTSTSDYFGYTGLQVETGKIATPFEHRSYGEELALCHRYYYRTAPANTYSWVAWGGYSNTTSNAIVFLSFPQRMRAVPTLGHGGNFQVADGFSVYSCSNPSLADPTQENARIDWNSSGLTVGKVAAVRNNNDATAFLEFKAEL